MSDEINRRANIFQKLYSGFCYWEPGKIAVPKHEIQNDPLIEGYDLKDTTEGLARLEIQIDKMTRNKKP